MTPTEQDTVRSWSSSLTGDVHVRLCVTQDERSKELERFCAALAGLAPRVVVAEQVLSGDALPALGIGRHVSYHGVPLGTELPAFLEVLRGSGQAQAVVPPLGAPASVPRLKLYVAQQCPHCPRVFATVASMASELDVGLRVVEVGLFQELAAADRAAAVPTLLVDGRVRLVGRVAPEDVEHLLTDPRQLGPGSLRLLLEKGNASALAAMMLERAQSFPALVPLLCDATFSVRLGAMAVMEEVAEAQPAVAAELAALLWERFEQVSDEVRGDLLYLFGTMGDQALAPRLRAVLEGEYSAQVKESAQDALDGLERSRLSANGTAYRQTGPAVSPRRPRLSVAGRTW